MKKKQKKERVAAAAPVAPVAAAGPIRPPLNIPWRLLALVSLPLLILAVYFPALSAPFYYDDYETVVRNPNIKSLPLLLNMLKGFYYQRGWVQATLALDWRLYAFHPWGFHLTNILLHAAVAFLVWWTTVNLFNFMKSEAVSRRQAWWIGCGAAVFFALHPINTEVASYVISRADSVATIFYLLTFTLALKWHQRILPDLPWYWQGLNLLGISLLLGLGTALGLGGKEIIVTAPVMFFVTVFLLDPNRSWRGRMAVVGLYILPLAMLFMVYVVLRIRAYGSFLGFADTGVRPWDINLMTQITVVMNYYVPKVFFPARLNFLPEYRLVESLGDARLWGAVLLFAFITGLCLYSYRKRPIFLWGWLWFLITLSVTSSVIPIFDVVAERRVYLPLAGAAIALSALVFWLIQKAKSLSPLFLTAAALYIGFLAILTLDRNQAYADPVHFWRDTAKSSPRSMTPFINLVDAYLVQGREAEALTLFNPNAPGDVKIVGRNLTDTRHLKYLIEFLFPKGIFVSLGTQQAENAVQSNPNDVEYLETLQRAYYLSGRFQDLQALVDKTLQMAPQNALSIRHAALLEAKRGEIEPALQRLETLLQSHPNDPDLYADLIQIAERKGLDTSAYRQKRDAILRELYGAARS